MEYFKDILSIGHILGPWRQGQVQRRPVRVESVRLSLPAGHGGVPHAQDRHHTRGSSQGTLIYLCAKSIRI